MDNQPEKSTKQGNPAIWVVLVIVLVLILGGAYIMFVQENEDINVNNANAVVTANQNANTNVNAITSDVDTSDWLTYTNEKYGYSVKYPSDATYQELTSGSRGDEDLGYIVNFTIGDLVVRILATSNAGATTLNELVNSGVALLVSDKNEYSTVIVNDESAWIYDAMIQSESGTRMIGATSILLGETYYYQITTGNQYAPEFTPDREEVYDAFVSTFELL